MSTAVHQANQAAAPEPAAANRAPSALVQRRCACGGKAGADGECAECRKKRLGVQARLRVQPASDRFENEAERVAARVLSPGGRAPAISSLGGAAAQREAAAGGPPVGARAEAGIRGLQAGGGRSLGRDVRSVLEPGFGHSFADVRVHTGERASRLAGDLGARAFTVGRDVAFARGEFDTGSERGLRLLAHELTHVVQQRGGAEAVARSPAGGAIGQPACGNAICPGVDCGPCGGLTDEVREAKRRVIRLFRRTRRRLRRIEKRRGKGKGLSGRLKGWEGRFREQTGAEPLDALNYETGRADTAQGTTPVTGSAIDRVHSILETAGEFLRSARVLKRERQTRGASTNVIVCASPERSCLCEPNTFAVYQNSAITICPPRFEEPFEARITKSSEREKAEREVAGRDKLAEMSGSPGFDGMAGSDGAGGGEPEGGGTEYRFDNSGATLAATRKISERTAYLAHEAIHHATRGATLDVYRHSRLFGLLQSLGTNTLPSVQLENPDSIVRLVFSIAGVGEDLSQYDRTLAQSEAGLDVETGGDEVLADQVRANLAYVLMWSQQGDAELQALSAAAREGRAAGLTWQDLGPKVLHTIGALRGETVSRQGGSASIPCASGSRFDGILTKPFPCPRGAITLDLFSPLRKVTGIVERLAGRTASTPLEVYLDPQVNGGIQVTQQGTFTASGQQIPDASLQVLFDRSFASQPADAQVRGLIVALLIGDKIASNDQLARAIADFLADNAERYGSLRGGPPTIQAAGS